MKFIIVLSLLCLFNNFSLYAKVKYKKLVKLNNPWSITFITESKLLITEKKGNIKLFNINKNSLLVIPHNLKIYSGGQGGLLDIVYRNNRIWVSYSERITSTLSTTSIATSKFNTKKLVFKNIFQSIPPINSAYHFGSRLVLKDNFLYASIGERGKEMIAQDGTKHPGSIIRIFTDGTIPKNNPYFINKNNWLPEIYQIGLRNPQGLEFSFIDNNIYTTNHGAKGGDFFGKVFFGGNYGWKILGWGGKNYIGTSIGPKWKKGFNKALYYWVPSVGISSFIIYEGTEFPNFYGKAIIGSLKNQTLYSLDFANKEKNPNPKTILKNKLGKIRDLETNPLTGKIFLISDEYLWIIEKS